VNLNGTLELRNLLGQANLDIIGDRINVAGDITVAGSWADASITGYEAVNVLGIDTSITVQATGGNTSASYTPANLRITAGASNTDASATNMLIEGKLEAIADGVGNNVANVYIRNYTGRTSLDTGAGITARAGDFTNSVATNPYASAYVQFQASSGSINVNGDLLSEARGTTSGYAVVSLYDYTGSFGTSGASTKITVANGVSLTANGYEGQGQVNLYGNSFNVAGNLTASGDNYATINFYDYNYGAANNTLIGSTARLSTWSEFGQSRIHIQSYTSSQALPGTMTIDGTLEAGGGTYSYIQFQNDGLLNVRGDVHAQALGTPSSAGYAQIYMYGYGGTLNISGNVLAEGGSANIQTWNGTGSNAINVTGSMRAEGANYAQLYFYDYYGGADDITIGSTATVQAVSSLGNAYISFYDYSSTADLPGSLTLDGLIEATGATYANINIQHDGLLEIRTDLVAEALGTPSFAGSAYVNITGYNGTTNISGNVLARGGYRGQVQAYHGSGAGTMNITGNLIAEGGQYANVTIYDYYGDGNSTNITQGEERLRECLRQFLRVHIECICAGNNDHRRNSRGHRGDPIPNQPPELRHTQRTN